MARPVEPVSARPAIKQVTTGKMDDLSDIPPVAVPSAVDICRLLASQRFRLRDELALQNGIAEVFTRKGVPFKREVHLDRANRPDFIVGRLAIEVKVDGSAAQVLRQGHRYLEFPEIDELLIVGTPGWMSALPAELAGKKVYALRLLSSLF